VPSITKTNELRAMVSQKQLFIDEQVFDIAGIKGKILLAEPMSGHTTWKVGGAAKIYYQPFDRTDLQIFLKIFGGFYPIVWLGLGSNVLVRDGGINGIVINALGCMNEIEFVTTEEDTQKGKNTQVVTAEAGVTCSKFSRTIADQGLHGAEFLSGIPGTMGGAMAMNAGAFGGECWNNLQSVDSIDVLGQIHHRTVTEYAVAYRSVSRKLSPRDIADKAGAKVDQEWFIKGYFSYPEDQQRLLESKQKIRQLLQQRNLSQPIKYANAGSVFKNPPGDYAARLIEACGLKKQMIGDACVSVKHANFIINQGGATARDIENLMLMVQQQVNEKFGIKLQPEVKIIGEQ